MRRISLMGCPVDALTMKETLGEVERIIQEGVPRQHMAVNAAKVVNMCWDADLRAAVTGSHLINADGASIVYAAKFLGSPLPERVAGCDLMEEILRVAPQKGWRVYFLGARKDVVERLVLTCRWRFPGLIIAGARDGFFSPEEERDVARAIQAAAPHILFVALPSPRKETFLAKWLRVMDVPFNMGVGGSFDVLAGELDRAPAWMRNNGLEWAHRLVLEPRRMWRRAVVDSAKFVMRVLQAKFLGFRIPTDPTAA